MGDNPRDGSVFYLGSRCFRARRTIWRALAWGAASGAAFLLVAWGAARPSSLSAYLVWIPLLGGTAALGFAVSLLTAFAVAQVDQVVISSRGVKCGDQFWDWQCVRAFRARRVGVSGKIGLFIWTKEDQGAGLALPIDEPITSRRASALIERVSDFCSTRRFNVKCEAPCEDVAEGGIA
jgi:hypothetical protein